MPIKSPAFQFYPKDWLSSRRTLMMDPAQEGAYIRLLCYCWDSGDCTLPDDDQELAALSRLGEGWFNGGSAVVRKCFIPHPTKPGHLTNERLLEEARKQQDWSRKSSEGGKRSAAKRAEKQGLLKGGSTVVQPSPSRPVEPKANSSSSSAFAKKHSETTVSSSAALPDWMPIDLWNDFLEMRRRKRAAPTERAKALLITKLSDWRAKGHDPSAVLAKSITSNWTDLFEPKEAHHENHRPHSSGHHQPPRNKADRARDAVIEGLRQSGVDVAAG